MGHTAEEKIKILYEDSLAEIRELTGRIELAKAAILSLPAAADKEMKRAGAETIAGLAAEVAKIAHRISDDSAIAERHKAFYLAAGLLSFSSTVFFAAGIFVAAQKLSWVLLGGVSLLIGIVGGMSLLIFLNGIDKKMEEGQSRSKEPTAPIPTSSSFWTDSDFYDKKKPKNRN